MTAAQGVLLLGPRHPRLMAFLAARGHRVLQAEDPIENLSPLMEGTGFLVSYGYRHLVRGEVLERFKERALNLHCSLLPWNRGADPNPWSFLEDTPKGVTIHVMDRGLDTGPVLAQRELAFTAEETLRTSYDKLARCLEDLFVEAWPLIVSGEITPVPQPAGGTSHRAGELEAYRHLLGRGWDTPVAELTGKGISGGAP